MFSNNENDLVGVSIIIPCRNEEKFIGRCLESIVGQDYPRENLEVLVVDGMSEDGTRDIIEQFKTMKQSQRSERLPRSFQSLAMTFIILFYKANFHPAPILFHPAPHVSPFPDIIYPVN